MDINDGMGSMPTTDYILLKVKLKFVWNNVLL